MVNIFDEDDKISFQKIPKLWFVMHVWVETCAEGELEGHFVSFHRRGDYYYVFGGEMNARLFKIHERHIATVFWEHHSVLLQLLRGDSWHAVGFTDPQNPHHVLSGFNAFVPKVFLQSPSRLWDRFSFEEICADRAGVLIHLVIGANDAFPTDHRVVSRFRFGTGLHH